MNVLIYSRHPQPGVRETNKGKPRPRGLHSSQIFRPPGFQQGKREPRGELSPWQLRKPGWIAALEAWVLTFNIPIYILIRIKISLILAKVEIKWLEHIAYPLI